MKHILSLGFFLLLSISLFGISSVLSAEEQSITIRSSYRDLTISQVQLMSNISIREKGDWGFCGHSTINNSYEKMSISGDSVVVNHTTGLMWHQSGSDEYIMGDDVNEWIRNLNSRGYAGYHDWRLPTVEEAASLLESSNENGFKPYIDHLFSYKQWKIWTGDKIDSLDGVWSIGFDDGSVHWSSINYYNFVRPVRSVKLYLPLDMFYHEGLIGSIS